MNTSIPACPDERIRSEKREHAGTFTFLASTAVTLSLQNAILPETLIDTEDTMVALTFAIWKTLTPNAEPIDGIR